MNKEEKRKSLRKASSNPKCKYTINIKKLDFDNLFIKHNWNYLELHKLKYKMGHFKSQNYQIIKLS